MVQGHPPCCVPPRSSWGREPFEQTLQSAGPSQGEGLLGLQLGAGMLVASASSQPAISPPPPPQPFCLRRGGALFSHPDWKEQWPAACGQTLKLCSWGEEWPPLCGGELGVGLVPQDGGLQRGVPGLSPDGLGPRPGPGVHRRFYRLELGREQLGTRSLNLSLMAVLPTTPPSTLLPQPRRAREAGGGSAFTFWISPLVKGSGKGPRGEKSRGESRCSGARGRSAAWRGERRGAGQRTRPCSWGQCFKVS